MKHFYTAAVAAALAGAWTLPLHAQIKPDLELTDASSSYRLAAPEWLERIELALQEQGTLEVLIEFDAPVDAKQAERAQSMQDGPQKALTISAERRAAVQEASRPMAAQLQSEGIAVIRAYDYQPLIHATITAKELPALLELPNIKTVHIDTAFRPGTIDEKPADDIARPNLYLTTVQTGATTAWSRGYRGQGYAVAILDSGILSTHEMFKDGKIIAEACYSTPTSSSQESLCPNGASSAIGSGTASLCPSENAICDHGSHVAGIAAGNNQAATAKRGVAPDAKIIAIQIFKRHRSTVTCDGEASCILTNGSDQLAAIDWLIANGPSRNLVAVNMSIGGSTGFSSHCDTAFIASGVNTLRSMGILTTISAGNEGFVGQVTSPGCIRNAVTVSGTNVANTAGDTRFNHASIVDLLAPGSSVESARSTSPTTYGFKSGTSMAAPHVAGAIAVLKSRMPAATPDQIEMALKRSGTATTSSSWTWSTPRINVNAAVDAVGEDPPPTGIAVVNYVPGANAGALSYLRLSNPTSSSSSATVTLMQDNPKKRLGSYTVTVPARGASQIMMRDLEGFAGASGTGASNITVYVDSGFRGYAQNILWNVGAQALTNLTTCKSSYTDPGTFLGNVHTNRVVGYTSYVAVHNLGTSAATATLDIYDSVNGNFMGSVTTSSIAANTTGVLTAQQALASASIQPSSSQFHVNFVLRSGFTGFVQHLLSNDGAGVFTDMTTKCPV